MAQNSCYDDAADAIEEKTDNHRETDMQETSFTEAASDRAGYLMGRAVDRQRSRGVRMIEITPDSKPIVDSDGSIPLEEFSCRKRGEDRRRIKSRNIRSYYKAQDDLISAYEDISRGSSTCDISTDDDTAAAKRRKQALKYSQITFAVNLLLTGAKLAASVLSGSLSIISSLVDSVVDLLSGVLIWWATRAMRKSDPYVYPQGRTKLEPVSIIILSVVMGIASLQLMRESIQTVVHLAGGSESLPAMEIPTFVIAGSTIVTKLVLWFLCRRVPSPSVQALAMDHRNDVMSNSVAIACGYLGSSDFQRRVGIRGFIYVDPVGALLISAYIIFNWWRTGREQIKLLTGHTARPDFLSKITWLVMNHSQKIRHVDTVRAFHFGNNFLVEVDIVLPRSMDLETAHEIGETLQQKLESMEEVERAFVHLDHEWSHHPQSEHKICR